MIAKFQPYFRQMIRKNRIQLLIFAVSSCLSIVWNLIGKSYSQLALIFTFVAVLSGTVCFFSVLITCSIDFYKRIRTESKADATPGKTLLFAVVVHLVIQVVIFAVFIGVFALSPYLRDTVSAAASTENIELIESFYGQDIATLYRQQAEAFAELVNSASEKGYTQPSFALAMIFNLLISYVTFLVRLYAAFSFSKLWRQHPLLASLFGYICLGVIGSFLRSFVASLAAIAAPGITAVSQQINALYSVRTYESATLYSQLASSLPEASVFIKVILFSGLCECVKIFTCAVVGRLILGKDFSAKIAK